jgi:hypothetical protein
MAVLSIQNLRRNVVRRTADRAFSLTIVLELRGQAEVTDLHPTFNIEE